MPSIKESFLNDGAVSPRTFGEVVYNDSGGALVEGDLVYFSGYLEPSSTRDRKVRKVKKADANVAGAHAQAVCRGAIPSGSQARVYATHRLTDVNTSAASATDDPVYLSETAGGWTLSAPSAAGSSKQIVGRVAIDATLGAIEFNLANPVWTMANTDLQAGVLSADATGRALMADDFFNAATVLTKFDANAFDATNVDLAFATGSIGEDRLTAAELNARVAANQSGNTAAAVGVGRAFAAAEFGIPILLALVLNDGASGNYDFTGSPYKFRIVDAWAQQNAAGNAGNSWQLQTAAGAAITDAFVCAGGDTDIGRAGEISDATADIASAGTLRVATVKAGGSTASTVYVLIVRIP